MKSLPENWEKRAKERQKEFDRFLLKADHKKILAHQFEIHEEVSQRINCLECANCCKNYSPRFKTPDIKRISKLLKIKESVFIDQYLRLDEEGDYVVKSTPCPFLSNDNSCQIYDSRPSDCARFPYTDEDVLFKRKSLTLKNSKICPIVYEVLDKLILTIK
ncbi:MAG: YkgJ family cysteine cluster protein [Chitinophagaceae bacterium]